MACSLCFVSMPLSSPSTSASSTSLASVRLRSSARFALPLRFGGRRSHVVAMAPEEEKMTRRSPLDFPIVINNKHIEQRIKNFLWETMDVTRASSIRLDTNNSGPTSVGTGFIDTNNSGPTSVGTGFIESTRMEWERPRPGRRPDIFPQFSPMKTPLPPPLPADPPEEDEEEEEKKEDEEEENPEKEEEPEKPEKQS
ncbi:hypothetical protein Syun_025953 [Stephania yunnanensis]|uniref:Uncharacterized protein n=1 Tax=Stephania yunnanensis TaxID=152371 RepID=A0AAP0HRR6_9MAGN